jgi:uncharacterized protein YhhL (DUF1145 family)
LASLISSSSFTISSTTCSTYFERGLLSWTPFTSSVPSKNITFQLLMILLVFTHIKQYVLVLSQYPKNTQGMDLDSNLLIFSSWMCINALQSKIFKWNTSSFLSVHVFYGVFDLRALVGHRFLM